RSSRRRRSGAAKCGGREAVASRDLLGCLRAGGAAADLLENFHGDAFAASDSALHEPVRIARMFAGKIDLADVIAEVICERADLAGLEASVRAANEGRARPMLPHRLARKSCLTALIYFIDVSNKCRRALSDRAPIEIFSISPADEVRQDRVSSELAPTRFPTALKGKVGKRVAGVSRI